ncbi:hypothetical protein [Chitinophaga lutea]|uniref:hypothetical protein n=1 Tax=Chitinophaga lutea TaxID=2488634 RepID=UPI0013153825|nr:hypothetical protein [Chitinophaga lutea]
MVLQKSIQIVSRHAGTVIRVDEADECVAADQRFLTMPFRRIRQFYIRRRVKSGFPGRGFFSRGFGAALLKKFV